MALKTFNIDEEVYSKYSKHCKEQGISMSKQVERFIAQEISKLTGQASEAKTQEGVENKLHPMKKFC